MVKVAVAGLGYWGPNLLRNFYNHELCEVVGICDIDSQKVKKFLGIYQRVRNGFTDFSEILKLSADLVVIATPPETHYELSKKALLAGKHVLVAKPFTTSSSEAEELIDIAERKGLKIFVDHTFAFNPCVRKIKHLIESGELGNILYFDCERVRGVYNVDVIWDLAVHDFSIISFLGYEIEVQEVISTRFFGKYKNDIAHITFTANGNVIGHIYVNWFSPVKIRKMIIGGDKKVLWWDDVHPFEKIKVYDADRSPQPDENPFFPSYISGDIRIVRVDNKESLAIEVDEIIKTILNGGEPLVGGKEGLKIVRILEKCDRLASSKR
ncbi:putative oxidoreductase YhhX [bacterium HR19]|nr:putative oxidoreductase YhhX [bacterium HR19]